MKKISYNEIEKHRLAGILVYTAMRLEKIADNYIFQPMHLSTASFRILMMLRQLGPQSPSDIMEALGGTKYNITQRLNHLAKKKMITLKHGEEKDKRRSSAAITASGRAQVNQALKTFKKHDLHVENYFTTKEMQDLLRLIRKLNAGLDQCESGIHCHYENKKK